MQYTNVNGYLLPNLLSTDTVRPIGRYGEMRRQFLESHRPDLLDRLLLEDRLNRHLSQVDEEARQAVQECVARMARQQQVDEALKRANPMEWVRRMNLIRDAAEQAILPEFLYPEALE